MAARRLTRASVLQCEDCGARQDLSAELDEEQLRQSVRDFVAAHQECRGFTLALPVEDGVPPG